MHPQPAPSLELGQTYVSVDNHLSVSYPVGWVISDAHYAAPDMRIWIANSECARDFFLASDDYFAAGDFNIMINVLPITRLFPNVKNFTDTDLEAAARMGLGSAYEFDEPSFLSLNGRRSAKANFVLQHYAEGFNLVTDLSDGMILIVTLYTPRSEFALWEATALKIAESIKYDPLHELTIEPGYIPTYTELEMNQIVSLETYDVSDQTLSFRYPSNWFIEMNYVTEPNIYLNTTISNKRELLNSSLQAALASGEVRMTLGYGKVYNASTNAAYTPEEWLRQLRDANQEQSGVTFSEIEETCLLDEPAVRMYANSDGNNDSLVFAMQDTEPTISF